MWELIVDLVFNIFDGLFSLRDDESTCFGCLSKAISIIFGVISAIIHFILLIAWIFSLL